MCDFAVLCPLLQRLAVFDTDKGAGNDDETREQDPCAEGREEVVGPRHLV